MGLEDASKVPLDGPSRSQVSADNALSRRDFLQDSALQGAGIAVTAACLSPPAAEADPAKEPVKVPITLEINGRRIQLNVDSRTSLLDAIRDQVGLTGTKKGCDHGQCGACTVLINGRRVYSCLTLAVMQSDSQITTIEGLARGDQLHPVQEAFIHHDAFQCGYCTSGQICSAVGLLAEGHAKTDAEVRELMSGNLCRCGAYTNIVAAIQDAQKKTAAP